MLKQLYRAIVMGSQASAARQTLPYLTDSHLNDMGFSRDTYIEGIQARISAELDAAEAKAALYAYQPISFSQLPN